jgi:CRP/FNR family transcriptional regulator, cyclic AMP receptor protein
MPFHRGNSEHIRMLGQVSLFRACTEKELSQIQSITTEVDLPANDVLCKEGTPGLQFFIILEGQAAVTIGDEHKADLGPGDFFGEMALLDGGPRIATVTSSGPMRVLVLSRREFFSLLDDAPTVARQLLTAIGTRLREAEKLLHPVGV